MNNLISIDDLNELIDEASERKSAEYKGTEIYEIFKQGTKELLNEMVDSGLEQGFSLKLVYLTIKLATSKGDAMFSTEDVMEITGETRESIESMIVDLELEKKGMAVNLSTISKKLN